MTAAGYASPCSGGDGVASACLWHMAERQRRVGASPSEPSAEAACLVGKNCGDVGSSLGQYSHQVDNLRYYFCCMISGGGANLI
jgi:hypothetical protein